MELRDGTLLLSSNNDRDAITELEDFIEKHLIKLCEEVLDNINGKAYSSESLMTMIAQTFYMHYGISNARPIVESMVKYAAMKYSIRRGKL